MRSSTFNSNDRLPRMEWRKVCALTTIFVVASLAAWNAVWVSVGFPLAPRDNFELWSYHRRRASRARENALVFVGSSRIKAGIDLDEARARTGKIPFQLAIAGKSPIPVLENLAADQSFNGTIVVEITEYILYMQRNAPEEWTSERGENKYGEDYIFPMKSFAQSLIASPNLGDTTSEVLTNIMTGRVFDKDYLNRIVALRPPTTSFNRSSQGYADKASLAQIERRRQFSLNAVKKMIDDGAPEKAKFADIAGKIESCAKRVRSRGGRVILVNLPLDGEVKDLNEKYFPKTDFWDNLVSDSSAEIVDYADHPRLAAIETLDGTHFSGKNATLFTAELFNIINRGNR